MAELNFPPGYLIGDHDEYQIIRRQPISDGVNNTFSEVYLVKKSESQEKIRSQGPQTGHNCQI